jgi:aldose 1-epimerase
LKHRGEEVLGRTDRLEHAAEQGEWTGIPLLHPWANRLAASAYRVAGREVTLDLRSPLLHRDAHGQPIHGVRWSQLPFDVVSATTERAVARLEWSRPELLAVFPFPHALEVEATLAPHGLSIVTTLIAGAEHEVPACFGYHSYFRIPGLPRAQWRFATPPVRRVELDATMIPTGRETQEPERDDVLGDTFFDNGYAGLAEPAAFSLAGADRRITVTFVRGYPCLQVYGTAGDDFLAIEPMTAPTNALITHDRLPIVPPRGHYAAELRVGVDDAR